MDCTPLKISGFICFYCIEAGSYSIVLAVLALTLLIWLALTCNNPLVHRGVTSLHSLGLGTLTQGDERIRTHGPTHIEKLALGRLDSLLEKP